MSTTLKFNITDAGRSASKRPRQGNDCTVRALATARNLGYDEAYELLKKAGRACSKGFTFSVWIKDKPWAKRISFPAVKGQPRMNPVTFVAQYPKGTYICQVAKHVFTCVDGIIHDTGKIRDNRCIYTAWQIGE